MARVLFLDPYHGPSHAALSTALRDHSRHQVTLRTLPPRKWKWRMRGAALAFEEELRALPAPPEALVTTDMLNLPELLGLVRDVIPSRLPVITYFHENQLTYPLPSTDERDFHFGLMNIYTALASSKVVFNSSFHREEFLAAVADLLLKMPDHPPDGIPDRIRRRSEVLGVPVDLPPAKEAPEPRRPLVLWNHRWEADKDPEAFFRVMRRLDRPDLDFKMVVLGQSFREQPACFEEARRALAHRIEHWGFLASRADYLRMVARCRVVVSTARHEFFGLAVREAIGLGCHPLLPRRQVYPEMIGHREEHLYDTEEQLAAKIERLVSLPFPRIAEDLISQVEALAPSRVVARWDEWLGVCPHMT